MSLPGQPAAPKDQTALLRQLPSVDELLLRPAVAAVCKAVDRRYAVACVRVVLAVLRRFGVCG